MSLKAFHIFFIALSALFAFGFSLWAMFGYASGETTVRVAIALIGFASGISLVVYGIRFLKKLRHVSFL